jgi:TatD DNase family protein
MTFIDVHCHLDRCKGNVEDIIRRAKAAGVGIIVNNGVGKEANRETLELSQDFNEVKAALGIYPLDALRLTDKEIDDEIDFISKNKERVVAIGEVGLDLKENKELEKQIKNLSKFINLAKELDIPIIVHSRKAERACIELLEKSGAKKIIMHCFSGDFKLVERIKNNKWYFSIPAIVKFSEHFQKMAKEIPIEQIFCETDSPYLHPDKKMNNEPAFVVECYKKIAEIKGIGLKECESKIEDNYKKLFEKA